MFKTRRSQKKLISTIIFLISAGYIIATQSGWIKTTTKSVEKSDPGLYAIDHYVDGDTIAVNMNGTVETIRFIGVDTPETHKPNTPVQCYGPDAAAYTKMRISKFGKVRLQADSLDTNRDRYGRLLRYVYLPDGTLMEAETIKNGFGFAYIGFPFEKKAEFVADMQIAQDGKKGLWSACQPYQEDNGVYQTNNL